MSQSSNTVAISAIVTAYQRVNEALVTLRTLQNCVPPPAEILVHVDGNRVDCAAAIRREFPDVPIILSADNIGPGGGRNKLVAAATNALVASFDDDSYPIDHDYFARLETLFNDYPDAAVIDARVFHLHQPIEPNVSSAEWVADFTGCGCAYRRDQFLRTGGYVALPTAYGMEEVDFGLRLHALGGRVLRSSWLRVFHDTDLAHHNDPAVTSASVANIALLTYLRYPLALWAVGAGQCMNRIQWLLRNGRSRGVLAGLAKIPLEILRHRHERKPLPVDTVRSFLALRRQAARV